MASIGSLSGSTSSGSIYGSRNTNIISGLASGLDTESMIEGMVQGYQQKITKLQQERTTLQWQQDAYQSISNKLVEFARKYTSYLSSTNLLSNTFFNNAVLTSTNGSFANLVSASGKTNSNVALNAVAQLATAARYSVGNTLGAQVKDGQITVAGEKVSLGDKTTLSTISGSLTLTYGNKDVTIDFGELELYQTDKGTLDVKALETAINDKLAEEKITVSSGNAEAASDRIGVEITDKGEVILTDKKDAGNSVYISGATGGFADLVINLEDQVENESSSFGLNTSMPVTETVDTGEYLSDKTLDVTFNGQTKQIQLSGIQKKGNETFAQAFARTVNDALDDAFGAGKIQVGLTKDQELSFSVASGNTLSVSSSAGTLLGMEDGALTSYLDAGKTLGDLLGEDMGGLSAMKAQGTVTEKDGSFYDEAGNLVDKDGYRVDSDGNRLYGLVINGVQVGAYTEDTALETVLNAVNTNREAGVNVSYSKLTNQFVFTAKETGEGGRIEYGSVNEKGEATDLAAALFGGKAVDPDKDPDGYTKGQDAVFQATINGETRTYSRSSNTFDMDGMSVTLNGTFNAADRGEGADPITSAEAAAEQDATKFFQKGEAVTFTSKTDTDTVVDAIKSMVEDYNAIVTEVKKAYSDMPLENSSGKRYQPLTDEDRADMSESEIEAYEEKAKTGILFMDRDLSSLYSALRSAVTPGGDDGSFLRSIGIKTAYEDGLTTITLDEEALREALETNPDQVRDAFVKSKENGSASNGLMTSIQQVVDRYAATTGANKGILIEKAGSKYAPTAALDNTLLQQMKEIDEQIEQWQSKISDRVDYYTNQFTRLEMLIQQMNSQSSSLAGLMGGY